MPIASSRKQIHPLAASLCAVALSAGIAVSVTMHRRTFDAAEASSYKQTDRYDDKFLALVDNMERDLAQRAEFGYSGGKDPIAGISRRVVNPVPQQAHVTAPAKTADAESAPPPDPVKLTAIIFDDRSKTYTAIIMDGERSYSVEVGDLVRGRTVRAITAEQAEMADDSYLYRYDIYGRKSLKPKMAKGMLGLLDEPSFSK